MVILLTWLYWICFTGGLISSALLHWPITPEFSDRLLLEDTTVSLIQTRIHCLWVPILIWYSHLYLERLACKTCSSSRACSQGEGKKGRKVKYSTPAVTIHLGLLAVSVVQETGWHQGAQRDKCSRRRSLCQSLCTLCQDTVSCNNTILCVWNILKYIIETVWLT